MAVHCDIVYTIADFSCHIALFSIIKDLVAGKAPAQKIIYTPEQGFDCDTLTQADVDTYGT